MSAAKLFELFVRTKTAAMRLDDTIATFNRFIRSDDHLEHPRVPGLARDVYEACEDLITTATEFRGMIRCTITDVPECAESMGCVMNDRRWDGVIEAHDHLESKAAALKEVLYHDLARKRFRDTLNFVAPETDSWREPNTFEAVFSHGYNPFIGCPEINEAIDALEFNARRNLLAIGEALIELRNDGAMIDAAMDKVIVIARPGESDVDYMGETILPGVTILDGAELDSLAETVIVTTKKFASGVKEVLPRIRPIISTMPDPDDDPQYLGSWDSAAWVLMNLRNDAEGLQAAVLLDRKEGRYTRTINLCSNRRRLGYFESQISKYAVNQVEADAEYRAAVLADGQVEPIAKFALAGVLPKSITPSAAERDAIRAQREADVAAFLRDNKTPTVAELLEHTKIPSPQTVYDMDHIPEVVAWKEYLRSKRKGRTPAARERQFAPGAENLIAAPRDSSEETLADLVAQQEEEARRDQRRPRRKQAVDQ